MPKQPKSPLGKSGFGHICMFYEVLLHTELKMGRNHQVFRRLTWKSCFPGLQEQDKIFLTLWIDNLVGLAGVLQGEAGYLSYRNTGRGCDGCTACRASWKDRREGKGMEKLERRALGMQNFGCHCWQSDALCSQAQAEAQPAPHPEVSAQLISISTSIPRHCIFSPLASFSLCQEEFLLSISSPTISPMAHKIIKTSPKLEQPLTLLSCSPIAQVNTSTLHH